ncbi:kinase-like protein [Echinococcus granulosus]|uniref:Kinase-like protein n=1 Tax=Echinococcus granulosus TaxID=6210 RepID=W6UJP3_ECHGR|nr:kinase-like protein [Echinococcus granulosus]EUB61263.1 kinase-like protein [Echinococcus granulosus]
MWIFSGKTSESITSASTLGSVLGSYGSDDSLASYTLLPPSAEELLPGPFDLHWLRQSAISQRKSSDRVTIFSCLRLPSSDSAAATAVLSQAVKRMKTLRHPNILNWLAGTEQLKAPFHIITEEVRPLLEYIREQADSSSNFAFLASWGIYQVTRALGFLNDDCHLSHNAVCAAAVYVNRSSEWKLGRLDYVTPLNEAGEQKLNIYRPAAYCPPSGHCIDAWGLACLIWEIFNPEPLIEASQLGAKASLERLPRPLVAPYRRLLATRTPLVASRARSPFNAFLKVGFFHNDYIDTLLFLEEIQLKDKEEKAQFLGKLGERAVGLFPDDICRYKILPHLVNSLQFGSTGVEALVPVLELAHLLPSEDFEVVVVPGLVRLFAAPDRSTRVRLLDQLPRFVDKLPQALVETQIFGPVSAGFTDANPLVREATIRAMVHLAPSLPPKILNDALVKHLTQLEFKDEQGGIRTNATICLAKLASRLDPRVRRGPLLNAFLRATRDPFPPSRQAAVTGLAACQAFFSAQELAGKVIPCLSFVAVDTDKDIRDTALKALHGMVERLEKASEDPSMGDADTSVLGGHAPSSRATAVAAAGGKLTAAGATIGNWALTALSSISSRLISSSSTSSTVAAQHATQAASGALTPSLVLDNGYQTAVSEQQRSGSMASSTATADAAVTKKPNFSFNMTEWKEEREEGDTKGKKGPAGSGWEDLDDKDDGEDDAGGWEGNKDGKLDLSSLPVTPKAVSPAAVLKQKRPDDLLIDWDESMRLQQHHQSSPRINKASSLGPQPRVSPQSIKSSVKQDWQWGEEEATDWNTSATASAAPALRPQPVKASLLNPPPTVSAASLRTSKTSVGGITTIGAWEQAKCVASEDDFFNELLGSKSTSTFGSSRASIASGHHSPALRHFKTPVAARKPVEVEKKDDDDGWGAW